MNKVLRIAYYMPISLGEKIITLIKAGLEGLGAASLISTGFWFISSPTASIGLGIMLINITIAAIAGMGFICGIIAYIISYINYKNYILEIKVLNSRLIRKIHDYLQLQTKLFFTLIRLRCLCQNDIDFTHLLTNINLPSEINQIELTNLINEQFNRVKNEYYHHEWFHFKKGKKGPNSKSFIQMMLDGDLSSQKSFQQVVLDKLRINSYFDIALFHCFKEIPYSMTVHHGKAAIYGTIAGITITGILLSTVWTFVALAIGAELVISVSLMSWALLGGGCIVLGVLLGISIGLAKQKNIRRTVVYAEIKKFDHILKCADNKIKNAYTKRMLELGKNKLSPQKLAIYLQIESRTQQQKKRIEVIKKKLRTAKQHLMKAQCSKTLNQSFQPISSEAQNKHDNTRLSKINFHIK